MARIFKSCHLKTFAALLWVSLGVASHAQEIQTTVDEYVVYHSAVKASRLPDASTERHDIDDEADNVVVTIAIRNSKTGENVYADLEVRAINAVEQPEAIEMTPTVANGMVSYTGIVDVTLPAELDIEIEFRAEGDSRTHQVSFNERVLEN